MMKATTRSDPHPFPLPQGEGEGEGTSTGPSTSLRVVSFVEPAAAFTSKPISPYPMYRIDRARS